MFGFWEGGPSVYAWSDESNRYIYIYKYIQVFAVCLISRFLGTSCMVKFQDKHKYYLKSAEGTDIEKKKKNRIYMRITSYVYVYNIMYTHHYTIIIQVTKMHIPPNRYKIMQTTSLMIQ